MQKPGPGFVCPIQDAEKTLQNRTNNFTKDLVIHYRTEQSNFCSACSITTEKSTRPSTWIVQGDIDDMFFKSCVWGRRLGSSDKDD